MTTSSNSTFLSVCVTFVQITKSPCTCFYRSWSPRTSQPQNTDRLWKKKERKKNGGQNCETEVGIFQIKTHKRFYRTFWLVRFNATNKKVRAKIQQAIGSHEDLLTIVRRLKLQWYGHVPRSSGLAKTILKGRVKVGRRRGRQKEM